MIKLSSFSRKFIDDFGPPEFASQLCCLQEKGRIDIAGSTVFGYILEGECNLKWNAHSLIIKKGMYFSLPSPIEVSGNAQLACFIRKNFIGLSTIGGPIESNGRLKYINNCTDTLLISPPRLGDACLNLLVFPPHTRQDKHIHPSLRLGVVASGSGICHGANNSFSLSAGMIFSIPAQTEHCFETKTESLRVIAYHPDSDQGPTDESHPMINRTILDY